MNGVETQTRSEALNCEIATAVVLVAVLEDVRDALIDLSEDVRRLGSPR
jgi:hypothetical protein